MRLSLPALVLTVGLGLPLAPGAAAAAEPGSVVDFDGDGGADVAVGAPGEDVGETVGAGSVAVFFSSERTPVLLSQASPGVPGSPETGDGFGATLAVGNFDSDAYSDLAVGVPGEALAGAGTVGLVQVFLGSAEGLRAGPTFSQASPGVPGTDESDDAWGSALAAGDANGDGFDDLAVGADGEDVGSAVDAGTVTVLPGGAKGPTATGSRAYDQGDLPGGRVEAQDAFGGSLALGDVTGDGKDDLVAGAPGEDNGRGAVHVSPGSVDGLRAPGATSVTGGAAVAGALGASVAVGDFDQDGFGDVVAGAPLADRDGRDASGAVVTLRGSAAGVDPARLVVFSQDSAEVAGTSEARDRFGSAVGTGDLDGDGRADLAVGVPGEAIGSRLRAGAVVVLKAGPGGLSGAGSRFLSQDTPGAGGTAESGDLLGAAVAVVDGDLVAGAPGEAVGPEQEAGALNVFVGTPTGLTGGPYLDEPRAGLSDALAGEAFGAAVAG